MSVSFVLEWQSTYLYRGAVLLLQRQAEWLSTPEEENTCAVHGHCPQKARKSYIKFSFFFFFKQ